jgi:hypothetical protein
MKAHAEGRVWPDRLRGQTGLVGAAQAAHVWGLRELATRTGSTDVVLSDVQVGSVAEESGGVTRVELVGLARPGEGVGGRASRGPRARPAVVRQVAGVRSRLHRPAPDRPRRDLSTIRDGHLGPRESAGGRAGATGRRRAGVEPVPVDDRHLVVGRSASMRLRKVKRVSSAT